MHNLRDDVNSSHRESREVPNLIIRGTSGSRTIEYIFYTSKKAKIVEPQSPSANPIRLSVLLLNSIPRLECRESSLPQVTIVMLPVLLDRYHIGSYGGF